MGHENGVALELVAVAVLLALMLPFFLEELRHRIMMNGNKQIALEGICARHPSGQSTPGRPLGDQQDSVGEATFDQVFLDLLCEAKVELIFRNSAGAQRTWRLSRVPDVDDDTKRRMVA